MSQFGNLLQEVVLEAGLYGRHGAVLVPGITVGAHGEGLNNVHPECAVPRVMLGWIGMRKKTRRGETVRAARAPVEINTECLDALDRLSRRRGGACRRQANH